MKLAIGLVIAIFGVIGLVTALAFADPTTPAAPPGRPTVPDAEYHARIGWRLVGTHGAIACDRCHKRNAMGILRYTGLVDTCASCHPSPHPAVAAIGSRGCDGCHPATSTSFKTVVFDHAKIALGTHARLPCESCHPSTTAVSPATACERCHAASPSPSPSPPSTSPSPPSATLPPGTSSHHGSRFAGKTCESCHASLTRWSANAYKHPAAWFTQHNLRHTELACRDCHRGKAPDDFEKLKAGADCMGCHAHRLVHADPDHPTGRYTKDQCLLCHTSHEMGRRSTIVNMAHGIDSPWPLVKGHKSIPCADCHQGRNKHGAMSFDHVEPNCGPTCHVDTLHRGSLGPNCETCHVPGTWIAMKFDHRTMRAGNAFELRGEHASQACDACHADRNFAKASSACVSCHAPDDAHRGSLGTRCESCHRDNGEMSFDHARSPFPLVGKHRDVACDGCHADRNFTSRPTRCAACHPVPRFHREARSELAWYDDNCEGCHSPRGW